MKQMKFIALLMALIILGCKTPPKKTETAPTPAAPAESTEAAEPSSETAVLDDIKIGELSWIVEQIAPSFWPKPLDSKSTMFVTFHMPVSRQVDVSTIQQIRVIAPKSFWVLEGETLKNVVEMNTKDMKLVIKRLHCSMGEVPLGDWKVDLTLTDGSSASATVTVNGLQEDAAKNTDEAPKTTDTSADSSGQPPEEPKSKEAKDKITYLVPLAKTKNQITTLALPVIKSVSRESDNIEILFSVNDKRVKNGYFWFDVPGEKYYTDSGSMVDASGNPVNGCRKFSTDGKECRYILRRNAENASWFSKITAIYFVVSDVNRVESPWEERIRSVSEKAVIKK